MRSTITALLLSLSILSATAPSRAAEGYWRADVQWTADREAVSKAVWKETWEATFTANRERWTQEFAAGDRRATEGHMHMRMALLLEAMLASKLPQSAETRNNAMGELAEHLNRTSYSYAANEYRKRIIDENPGDADLALKTLNQILSSVRWENDDRWTEYGSDRYMALNRLGLVPEGDQGFIEAIKTRAVFDRSRGAFLEAARDLELLKGQMENNAWWRTEQANLLAAAGHAEEALPMYEKILAESEANVRQDIRSQMAALGQNQTFTATKFGGDEALRTRWANLREREGMDLAGDLDALMATDVARMNLVPEADGVIDSLWSSVDRFARSTVSKDPAAARPLREARAVEAQARLEAARAGGRTDDLLAVFRRYPWTPAGQAALLDLADAYLRMGQPGLALRCYADLLDHADDANVRGSARVGIWTALAQQPTDRAALEAAWKDVPDGALFPWFGGKLAAGAIRQRLAAGIAAADPPPGALSQRELRQLRLPPSAAWPGALFEAMPHESMLLAKAPATSIQAAGDGLLVTGPCLLACYGNDLANPTWIRQSPSYNGPRNEAGEPDYFSMPGPFRPVIDGERVVTRWGLDTTERYLTAVAAFDLRTGRLAWSTADDPALRGLWPLADPTLAEGRLYVMARARAEASYAAACPTVLLCLDPRNGRLIWQRALAELTLTLGLDELRRKRGREEHADCVDLASYGNAVTVRDGFVYCSTSMGVVACCDGRDGTIEWARPYPRSYLGRTVATLIGRDGSSPIPCGDKVIFQPRDCWGVFALERRTGRVCWANPLLPCREVVGATDRVLVLGGERTLVGVDMDDGALLWERPLGQPRPTRAWVEGSDVLLLYGNTVYRLSSANGNTLEERAGVADRPVREVGRHGSALVVVADVPSALPVAAAPAAQAAASSTGLPARHLWSVPRSEPRFYVPRAEMKMGGRVFAVSCGVLDCIPISPGIAPWQRMIDPGATDVVLGQGLVLLVYPDRLLAVEASSGTIRWTARTDFAPDYVAITETYVVACDRDRRRFTVAVYEPATGRLLWDRELPVSFGPMYWAGPRGAQVVGANLYAIGMVQQGQREEPAVWTLRCADGAITARRPLLPPNSGGVRQLAMDGAWGCAQVMAGNDWRFCWFNVLDAAPPEDARMAGAPRHPPWGYSTFQVAGELVHVAMDGAPDSMSHYTVALRGSAQPLRHTSPGIVRGEQFYVIDKHTIKAVNLKTQAAGVQYVVPPRPEAGEFPVILDLREEGNTLLVVTASEHKELPADGRRRNPRRRAPVAQARGEMAYPRLDRFDLAGGNHLGGVELGDLEFWKLEEPGVNDNNAARPTQAVLAANLLLLADRDGVHAFGPAGETPAAEGKTPELISYRRPTLAPAAQPAENRWPLVAIAPDSRELHEGSVRVSHDDDDLHITVSYRADAINPRRGRREYSTGDWLEVGLTTNLGLCRFGVGVDELGRNVWENLCSGPLPQHMRCVVRQDMARGEHVYEVSIPLREVLLRDILQRPAGDAWRRVGLSLNVWEDSGPAGSRPILRFAEERSAREPLATHGRGIHLYPFTVDEDRAAAAIIERLGDLPESRSLAESLGRRAPTTMPTTVPSVAAADAVSFLETQVPRLGTTDAAMSFFKAMLRLEGSDSDRLIARYKWFLKTMANQPRAAEVLGDLLTWRRKTVWQCESFMDAVMEECKIPLRTRYDYRRRYLQPKRQFLQAFQVIGPFANTEGRGLECPYPPELERIRLEATYPGIVDQVRWRNVQATRGMSLGRALRLNDNNVVYLACWIRNPTARGATLELGADDGVKVWLNRRMVYAGPDTDGPGVHRAALYLPAGWSELLVKVAKTSGEWEFRAELVDPEGRGPLGDVQVTTAPP
ncbi:MAG: PQQ-binding-like beta-propeller repeat protein [Tepidisphaerales bacterium]